MTILINLGQQFNMSGTRELDTARACSHVGRPIRHGHVGLAHLDVESIRAADRVPHVLRLLEAVLAADDHAPNRVTKLLGIGPFQSLAFRVINLGLQMKRVSKTRKTFEESSRRAHLQARKFLHGCHRDEHIALVELVQLLGRRQ